MMTISTPITGDLVVSGQVDGTSAHGERADPAGGPGQ